MRTQAQLQVDEFEHVEHTDLQVINRNLIRLARMVAAWEERMATAEQVTALTQAVDELEAAESVEEAQIQAKLDELLAHQADQPDPALDAQIARLQALKEKVTAIIPDAPAEAPPAADPAADTTGAPA